jgi:hypothetical protein
MIKEQLEKRKGPRIHTALPVFLENAQGITRDVSATGVYFWTSRADCLPGELINFSVEVKRREAKVVLKCQGDVLRKEPGTNEIGLAVQITKSAMEQVGGA